MKDYSVLERMKDSAQSCEIPEGLKPENIILENPDIHRTKQKRKRLYPFAGVAAAMLVLAAAIVLGMNDQRPTDGKQLAVAQETAGEEEAVNPYYETARTYEDIYDYILENDSTFAAYGTRDGGAAIKGETVEEFAEADTAVTEDSVASSGQADYSETNTQVEGVDEGDIVKTDGQYLYILRGSKEIQIVKVSAGEMKEVSVINPESITSDISVLDMYLSGETLQIVCQRYENQLKEEEDDLYYMDYRVVTCVYTYDISKREAPRKTGMVEQDGSYYTSRKVGDYLYLFTSYYPDKDGMNERDMDGVVPKVGEETLEASDVYLPKDQCEGNFGYMIISSMDEKAPNKIKDKKAILESASRFYVSTENIYLERDMWRDDTSQTAIAKFSYDNGSIEGEGAAVINGAVTDDFANNEYDGYLRVLTTQWKDGVNINHVYVLDENMEIIGKIEGLAEDETIYSARFFGDIGYFVTYRQMDPLFTVDFSDPRNPKVIGELKITGFSEYLHFYGEDRLLGIGWETDPDTGNRKGLKLSMFDISKPSDVKEIDKMVVKNIDYFPGEYDYKAFTVSESRNVIGFLTTSYDSSGQVDTYMVCSYGEDGFEVELSYTIQDGGYDWYDQTRGVYIDDTFYIVTDKKIIAFDMADGYRKMRELVI